MSFFFFFNDTATTEIYTLSLHDALPISSRDHRRAHAAGVQGRRQRGPPPGGVPRNGPQTRRIRRRQVQDRKSTRLNSSHLVISYAVFCLEKKKKSSRRRQQRTRSDIDAR